MQGPHDFYAKTKLKTVLIQAELAANARAEAAMDKKASVWSRLRALIPTAILRPVARRV